MARRNTNSLCRRQGLTKAFGQRTVVDDVSFAVRRGEIFGFLGPNGSGKTTTIRMALDIIRPDGGAVSILGSPPGLPTLRAVGYLPEEAGLPPRARVLDTIRYLGRLKGLSRLEAESRRLSCSPGWACSSTASKRWRPYHRA